MPIIPDAELDRMAQSSGVNESRDQRKAKLKKATQEFESVFIGMMFKQVRKGMEGGNPLFGKSQESKLYQEMMDDTMTHRIAETGNFGIGKSLYKRLEPILFPEERASSPTKQAHSPTNPILIPAEAEIREKLASKPRENTDMIVRAVSNLTSKAGDHKR